MHLCFSRYERILLLRAINALLAFLSVTITYVILSVTSASEI